MRLVVVEDDPGVAAALVPALRKQGWSVRHAATATEAVETVTGPEGADLVLLDMGLPDHDGLWVCQQLRRTTDVPIVALTARRVESAVVAALRAGVDDYVVKPYSLAVLLARIDAVVRRTSGRAATEEPEVDFGVVLDTDGRRLTTPSGEVALTAKEGDLLAALMRAGGRAVARAALMEEVWDTAWVGASRTLDVHVAGLRAKLGDDATIETVRGLGYRLVPRDEA